MAVPSRKKATSRAKKGRSVKKLTFQKKSLQKPRINCDECHQKKMMHLTCLNCFNKKRNETKKKNRQ